MIADISTISVYIMLDFSGSDSLHFENSEMTHPYYFSMGYGNGKQECRRLAAFIPWAFSFPEHWNAARHLHLKKEKRTKGGQAN